MMYAAWLSLALAGAAQSYPDQIDVIRGVDRTPQIKLVIDLSGSMLHVNASPSEPCPYFLLDQGYSSNHQMTRLDELMAALLGCHSADDGILDRFASQVVFSMNTYYGDSNYYGINTDDMVPFPTTLSHSSDLNQLETAVRALPGIIRSGYGTPLVAGYRFAAQSFNDTFDNTNTEICRPNGILLMTDGVGNADLEFDFDWLTGPNAPAPRSNPGIRNASNCYLPRATRPPGLVYTTTNCPPEYMPPHLDMAAEYLYGDENGEHDALESVDDVQPLLTYTVGFSAPSAARDLLRDVAEAGGGEYFEATNTRGLVTAFEQAILRISENASGSFNGPTVAGNGFYTGNYVYQPYFQGRSGRGAWFGNIKKYCVYPEPYAITQECLFRSAQVNGEAEWVLNETPRDMWSGLASDGARSGGAGLAILQQIDPGATSPDNATIPSNPYAGRNIVTWIPGTQGYVDVEDPSIDGSLTQTLTDCEHFQLLNILHGYGEEISCPAGGGPNFGAPLEFDTWPMADSISGGQVLLPYTESCETPGTDRCYLVSVSNAGMLHIFDAVTGQETQAIVPPQLFADHPAVNNQLSDIMDQPGLDRTRRFFFDGGLALHHEDQNQDGVIDPGETSYLIAGLGRGGSGYIRWEVTEMHTSGAFTAPLNPPRSLFRDEGTGFRELQNTWAAPWLGSMLRTDGTISSVAVFPSGHIPELDDPAAPFATFPVVNTRASGDSEAHPHSMTCADLNIPAGICDTPTMYDICVEAGMTGCGSNSSSCSPCQYSDPADCTNAGYSMPYCYNWPGLAGVPTTNLDLTQYGITSLHPLQVAAGPFELDNGTTRGLAYRIRFSEIDLQSPVASPSNPATYQPDRIVIADEVGNVVETITGDHPSGYVTQWVRSSGFTIQVLTDGVNTDVGTGYVISGIDVVRDRLPLSTSREVRPSVYVVDIDTWNGDPTGFDGFRDPSDDIQGEGLLARFTSDCAGAHLGTNETCMDASTHPDLAFMTCPISAEPRVYSEGGLLRSIFVGDECGQVWSFRQELDPAQWRVRRLLTTNETENGGFVVAGEASRNYRKIFAPMDLVVSRCPGQRSVGVYFGTGNLQRPAVVPDPDPNAPAARRNPPLNLDGAGTVTNSDRDLMGVVWDNESVPSGGYHLSDLQDVTSDLTPLDPMDGASDGGFFVELDAYEKILRSPIVFEGVAYFQSYLPTLPATECDDASANIRMYAFDNCTAEPVTGNQRLVSEAAGAGLSSGFTTFVDPNNGVMITSGGTQTGELADIQKVADTDVDGPAIRLLMWRIQL